MEGPMQANLSALLESTEQLVWSVDLKYRLTLFNRAFKKHFKTYYDIDASLGMDAEQLLPPAKAEVFPALYRRALNEGPFQIEFQIVGGRTLQIAFNAIFVDGVATGVSAFGGDISQRKQAEAKLQESEERYRAAFQTSETRYRTAFQMNLDSIDICRRADGRFVDVNEAFTRCTGFTREEAVDRTAMELGIWVQAQDRNVLLDVLARDSVCENLEVQFRTKDGRLRWCLLSVAPVDLDGVPCILSITRDITDVKAANERLAAAQEAMRASEARYSTAFHMNLDPSGISRLDDGMYIEVNAAFVNTLGFTREEVLGKTATELGIFAQPGARDKLTETVRKQSFCRDVEIQLRKKTGETFWGAMSASLIELDGVPHLFTVTRDLSPAQAAEDQIYKLAFFDPLTQLPNRRLFLDRLRQALVTGARDGQKQALLLIDIDNFKALNDTIGYPTGDLLLQEVGRRISGSVSEADTVARLGGDEFAVMLSDLSKDPEQVASHAKDVADKILVALSRPYQLDGMGFRCSASVGVTVFGDPTDSTNEILQQADIAQYQAKTAGRNNVHFFIPALQAAVLARSAMEHDLGRAIEQGEFLHYYQPQLEGSRISGVEALIRWKHPIRGMVMPGEFIPLAEQTRLILPIGDWGSIQHAPSSPPGLPAKRRLISQSPSTSVPFICASSFLLITCWRPFSRQVPTPSACAWNLQRAC